MGGGLSGVLGLTVRHSVMVLTQHAHERVPIPYLKTTVPAVRVWLKKREVIVNIINFKVRKQRTIWWLLCSLEKDLYDPILAGRLAGSLAAGWLADWLEVWLGDWLAGRLAGWLAGFNRRTFIYFLQELFYWCYMSIGFLTKSSFTRSRTPSSNASYMADRFYFFFEVC